MTKRELDDLREIHMEFASLAHLTGSMDSNSVSDFFGWIYKQLGTRSDAEMVGFRKGREYAEEEGRRNPRATNEPCDDDGPGNEGEGYKIGGQTSEPGGIEPAQSGR